MGNLYEETSGHLRRSHWEKTVRILMLAQFYPPAIGGVERLVHDLSIELVARGHDVAVATLWHEGMPEFECDQGVRIYRIRGSLQRIPALFIDKGQQHSPPFPDPEVVWTLRRLIMRECPDIVHAHNWMVHSFTPLKAWSKAKLVVSLHDCSHVCAKQAFVYHGTLCDGPCLTKCLECATGHYGIAKGVSITLGSWSWGKLERRVVDMFLPVSEAIAEANLLAKRELPYHVIPNFIPNDLDVLDADIDPYLAQLPKDDFLLFVGSVGQDKGVQVLLQAYAEMRSQIPLVLIGRPGDGFPSSFPPNVHFLQSWPHAAVMNAWKLCTIALVPSICLEAFGMVALEAMAMGRPVVATRVGGLAEVVVDRETGLLVPPGDLFALQKAIQCLLANPVLREHMGVKAKQRAIQFQAGTVVPRIEQIYQEVLHPRRLPPQTHH